MEFTLYDYLWYFVLYSFFGWCLEVLFAAVNKGAFVNRGFLNGPWCPIYGVGVCLILLILAPVQENLLLLFAGSVILTSLLELIVGFVLEKLFHMRWWDYSEEPFNLGGYIGLRFSLLWGPACLLVIEVIHPLIANFVPFIPRLPGIILLVSFLTVFLADSIITVLDILKLNKRLAEMDQLSSRMKEVSENVLDMVQEGADNAAAKLREGSDTIGRLIADGAMDVREKVEDQLEASADKRAERRIEFQKWKIRFDNLAEEHRRHNRLLRAFPDCRSTTHQGMLADLRCRTVMSKKKSKEQR